MGHFLLHSPALACLRNPIIDTIVSVGAGVRSPTYSPISFLQLVLDHSALTCDIKANDNDHLQSIKFHCRRLCHILHCERSKPPYRTMTIYNVFFEQNKMAEGGIRNTLTGDYVGVSSFYSHKEPSWIHF